MKKITTISGLSLILILLAVKLSAQVSINNDGSQPDNSAMLDVKSTIKGLLPPRMSAEQRNIIVNPAEGLQIYNTDCKDIQFFNGTDWIPVGNIGLFTYPSGLNGNFHPCVNSVGNNYSISAVPEATGYSWTVPIGATITNGQGTNSIVVSFGTTSGFICYTAYNSCTKGLTRCFEISLTQSSPVSVSITASSNPFCTGTVVNFSATPTNGGSTPHYQWKVNGFNTGSDDEHFSYNPVDNDIVTCTLLSNLECATGNPATSNSITMSMIPHPDAPVEGINMPSQTQIIWNWNSVPGATGYKFNVVNDINSSIDMGNSTTRTETDLSCNTAYTRYVWAYNSCGNSISTTLLQSTSGLSLVSVSIATSANQICTGTFVTFTATPTNGGTNPIYEWKVNGESVGSNTSIYGYVPENNDIVTCVMTSNATCITGNPATSNAIAITAYPNLQVSITIAASVNPVCAGTPVTLTATPSNGGTTPTFQWKVNGNNAGTNNATFLFIPENNDIVTCVLISNANCVSGNPATSNSLTMSLNQIPANPVAGQHIPSLNQIVWKWNSVLSATGYKWSATNDFSTALDMSLSLLIVETGLFCNTNYTRYVWAYNECGYSLVTLLTHSTLSVAVNAPTVGTIVPSPTQIIWNWNSVSGATGYKWSSTNNYITATDLGMSLSQTETGLTCNTSYTRYIWAYQSCGNSIATTMMQSTSPCPVIPTVTTTAATGITQTSTITGGNVTTDGGAAVTMRGVCWSSTTTPTIADSHTVDGSGSGTFTSTISGLNASTTYYTRAYATNSVGTAYGSELSFTTLSNPINITNVSATNVSHNSARLNCFVNPNGLSTDIYFEYGTTTNYGSISNGTPLTVNGTVTTTITADISTLLSNQIYHFRVKAVNNLGTFYSPDYTFTTYTLSWNMSEQYSNSNNPNGAWSYGRKWSAATNNFDLMSYIYNGTTTFWLLGYGIWYPSIQAGPWMWSGQNTRGMPCTRWTCPESGFYNLTASFTGYDAQVYITKNDSIIFSALVQPSNQTTNFSVNNLSLSASDHLDFLIMGNGDVWIHPTALITK